MIPHHIATSIVLYEPVYGNLDLREVIFQLFCWNEAATSSQRGLIFINLSKIELVVKINVLI